MEPTKRSTVGQPRAESPGSVSAALSSLSRFTIPFAIRNSPRICGQFDCSMKAATFSHFSIEGNLMKRLLLFAILTLGICSAGLSSINLWAAEDPATTNEASTTADEGETMDDDASSNRAKGNAAAGKESEATDYPIAPGLDGADTAWMLVSCALVLMMTAPGLALFYGGLVRKKNILSVMMQCIFLMGLMSVVWAVVGYSLAFGPDLEALTFETGYKIENEDGEEVNQKIGLVGNFDYVMLNGVLPEWIDEEGREVELDGETVTYKNQRLVPMEGTITRSIHMAFQMMFFIITPALICGAFAERMKFSAMALFSVLWGLLIYCPICHWVWSGNGWLLVGEFEGLDFAGGTVVHISSGVSALVCCLLIGRRLGFGQEPMPPHNLTYTCIGAAMLWVGWFGFNAGSAVAADAVASNAFVATHLAAAAGVISWTLAEWFTQGKPSILGAASGAVAGLVCITPAAGAVNPLHGMILGAVAGVACYWAVASLKQKLKYDDSLDAFGVHGVGGTVGAILTGVFATAAVTGGMGGLLEAGNTHLMRNQFVAIGASAGLAIAGSFILLKIIDVIIGLRVEEQGEIQGLDLSEHGEEGYIFL